MPTGGRRRRWAGAFSAIAVALAIGVGGGVALGNDPPPPHGFEPDRWLQGAEGLFGAIESLNGERAAAPMVVYFYTDWCGYCRQFERELLGTPEVKKHLEDVLAVRINPESGAPEREIAEYYGVAGYPAFFVHSGRSRTLSRVERMLVEQGRPRLMTPDEFIAALAAAGSR
ncbi:MAG TPA: thioredoxin fold domain-containing protein [Thermoanaerobaculia bacterium]|nr:thioredoxin fold domain-containing protein [Thermoanaerobaculia bacterium]